MRLKNFQFHEILNNNQPYSNVNLAVNEVEIEISDDDSDDGSDAPRVATTDHVTYYSLYDDQSEAHGSPPNSVDSQLPRPSENLKFLTNEFGFLDLLEEDTDGEESCDSSCGDSDGGGDDGDDDREDDEKMELFPCDEGEELFEELELREEPSMGIVVSCVTCGCFAFEKEFYDTKHCTRDCSLCSFLNNREKREDAQNKKVAPGITEVAIKTEEAPPPPPIKQEVVELSESELMPPPPPPGPIVKVKRVRIVEREEELDTREYWVKRAKTEQVAQEECKILVNPFRVNDLLEAIDPQHQSLFCPVTVVEVIGFRLLLKFIGYSDKYNFWVNADSNHIFPVNWSTRYTSSKGKGTVLHFHAPPNFSWDQYIESNNALRVAPDSNFMHTQRLLDYPESRVRVGMKVEALDRRNKNLICVATVTCVMGDKFLIHFDSWDSLYDYWTFIGSGDIHPVGYCKEHGIDITPPHCYENASEFEWEEYLKKTNSVPMPEDLMTRNVDITLTLGQQVEVIDKRSPRLLRLATISSIIEATHTVTVTFPSLKSDTFDYDLHAHSPDIHLLGWGSITGHPLADDDEEDGRMSPSPEHSSFPVCPNHSLCKSVCNVRGPNFPFHSKIRDCPYSPANMLEYCECGKFTDRVVVFEDAHYDLGGTAAVVDTSGDIKETVEEAVKDTAPQPVAVVVTSNNTASVGTTTTEMEEEEEEISNDKEQVQEEADKVVIKEDSKLECKVASLLASLPSKPQTQALLCRNSNPINFNKLSSVVRSAQQQQQQMQQIPKRSEILTWSHDRISSLVQSLCSNLPTAQKVADQFRNNLIDGESFLMLRQNDLTQALQIKLGPAVKIYNLIRLIDLNK